MLTETGTLKPYRDILHGELAVRRAHNPRYSLRAFARDLGLAPSRLCEVLSGRASLSIAAAERVVARLDLPEEEGRVFCDLVLCEGRGPEREHARLRLLKYANDQKYLRLREDSFRLIADWYHLAIVELTYLPQSCDDPAWIAATLRITPAEAADALGRLLRLGMIERRDGRLSTVEAYTYMAGDVPSESIRRFHDQIIGKARAAVGTQTVEERNLEAYVMAIDTRDIPLAKAKIRAFCRELCDALGQGSEKTAVYAFATQFFSLTGQSLQGEPQLAQAQPHLG